MPGDVLQSRALPLPGRMPLDWGHSPKSLRENTELHCYPFPSAEDTRTCRVVSPLGSIPWRCSLQAYYGEHITLAATSSHLLFRKRKAEEEPTLWSCRELGAAWGKGLIWLIMFELIWAHLSLRSFPMMEKLKPQLFCLRSRESWEDTIQNSKPAAEDMIQKSLCWLCAIWSLVYKHINTFVLMDVLPQPDRKHLCFMICNSSSVSRQTQWMESYTLSTLRSVLCETTWNSR